MKQSFLFIGGIAVLFIIASGQVASAKTADGMIIKKQEQRTGQRPTVKKKAAAKKPAVEAAPKQLQQAAPAPRVKFKYIRVQAPLPWYYNIWILFLGGSFLFLLGGIIDRLLIFGFIPRKPEEEYLPEAEEAVKTVEPVQKDWLKKFFERFWKTKTSCQPAA